MSTTCYVTFSERHSKFQHKIDARAHHAGWFEFVAEGDGAGAYDAADTAADDYLWGEYEATWEAVDFVPGDYPSGCLARFRVGCFGEVREVAL